MELITTFFNNLFLLASAMSLYILVGLLVAGVLKQFISDNFISKHLGKSSIASVIKATILGTPLPVCSCSVIPIAKSLEKEGASRGSVLSFLISAPITGADSILATYSFFGWIFTIYRVATSIVMAIVVGVIENIFNKPKVVEKRAKFTMKSTNSCSSSKQVFTTLKPETKEDCCSSSSSCCDKKEDSCCSSSSEASSCCDSGSCCSSTTKQESFGKRVLNYAFNTLFGDIAKSLFIGLVLGALFTTFMPKDLMAYLFDSRILSYFLVLLIAMPMYVCATSSLPIAAAFVLNGMSAGAAFIFLSAGPATSTVTMGVVASMFGKRTLFVYIGVIAILSIVFGFLLDTILPTLNVGRVAQSVEQIGALDTISTFIMFALMAYYMIKRG